MSSNPNFSRDSSSPSLSEGHPIRPPFLDCPFKTGHFVKDVHLSKRNHIRRPNQYSTRRSCSEGSFRPGSMRIFSYDRWRADVKHCNSQSYTNYESDSFISSLFNNLQIHIDQPLKQPVETHSHYGTDAAVFSSQFPEGHQLNADFVKAYQLQDELGCGGYGFVMTAFGRTDEQEVAVKFIIKAKVPDHAWMEDRRRKLPAEVVLLGAINHENIVKCLDLYEDELYFYMVQELHGSPWESDHNFDCRPITPVESCYSSSTSLPTLSPSSSNTSLPISEPTTPSNLFLSLKPHMDCLDDSNPQVPSTQPSKKLPATRPEVSRRSSHDLFECIEQSENRRLTEDQARFVFAQIVEAVEYLDSLGIAHRDIKDENVVIDRDLKIKLIDFGSAIAVDPTLPRPLYTLFHGTAAYASSEILLKQEYKAAPAEIWTIGVLLSYLLGGVSPFPTVEDAVEGRILLAEEVLCSLSDDAMDLMGRCLNPNPETRATIAQVKAHPWLRQSQ